MSWMSTRTFFNGLEFFDKKMSGGTVDNENISNKELDEELHKTMIKYSKTEKYTHFMDKIWGADLAE